MQKLSPKKQLEVVRLYIRGLPYGEIAAATGVSKGSVANTVAELKAGRVPNLNDLPDQLDVLRELGTDLRRLNLAPGQALIGAAVFANLLDMGIEPSEIQAWASVYRHITSSESERGAFLNTALHIDGLRQSTGLTLEELEDKARHLEDKAARLKPAGRKLRECERQLAELEKKHRALSSEVSGLEKKRSQLARDIAQKEKREAELSPRVQRLEHRAHQADERLAAARKDTEQLAAMGLSIDDLRALRHRTSAVAQRHGMGSEGLRERFFRELDTLEAATDLEARLAATRKELDVANGHVAAARKERKAEERALTKLRQEQANIRAECDQQQAHLRKELQSASRIATEAANDLQTQLRATVGNSIIEVQSLREQAFQLGAEIGRCSAIVEANQWLQTAVSLIRGEGGVTPENARTVVLPVLRGLRGSLQQNEAQTPNRYLLTTQLDNIISELERWQD